MQWWSKGLMIYEVELAGVGVGVGVEELLQKFRRSLKVGMEA